jgi:hypothetical protein
VRLVAKNTMGRWGRVGSAHAPVAACIPSRFVGQMSTEHPS